MIPVASRPRRRATALAGLLLGLLLALTSAPAFAHDELIGTDPAAGSTVEELPDALTLTFSGVLLTDAGATEVSVVDAACAPLTSGTPVIDGTRITQALSGDATGAVTVLWRTVSSDSHPISGSLTFVVGDGDPAATCDAATSPGGADGAAFDVVPLLVVGGVVVVGAGILLALLLARRRPSHED